MATPFILLQGISLSSSKMAPHFPLTLGSRKGYSLPFRYSAWNWPSHLIRITLACVLREPRKLCSLLWEAMCLTPENNSLTLEKSIVGIN
jgi:hypothetical protein